MPAEAGIQANAPNFEIRWEARGFFSAELVPVNGKGSPIANQIDPGPGRSYVPEGGDYYLKINALGTWHIAAVALPPGTAPEAADLDSSSSDDQSNLPPCDGPDATSSVSALVESSPLGQVQHLQVLQVEKIDKTASPKVIMVCHALMLTTGGERHVDFQNIRRNGEVFVTGQIR